MMGSDEGIADSSPSFGHFESSFEGVGPPLESLTCTGCIQVFRRILIFLTREGFVIFNRALNFWTLLGLDAPTPILAFLAR